MCRVTKTIGAERSRYMFARKNVTVFLPTSLSHLNEFEQVLSTKFTKVINKYYFGGDPITFFLRYFCCLPF